MLASIRDAWATGDVPIAVLPTGGGKTVVFARALAEHDGPAVAIAHRRELVAQMSIALAREGVRHRIIAPRPTIRGIVRKHTEQFGRSFYSPNASIAVAGVDSIPNASDAWCATITLWIMDEAHHPLRANKWGKALARFPNARGLGVTATPGRADGRGLGAHADGVFTRIVEGPTMRELIEDGYLCDYDIACPPSDLDLANVAVSRATGDYSAPQLRKEMRRARITGDVVASYQRFAAGRIGVTFAVDIESAHELAQAYRDAGVPALAVSSKTPARERDEAVRALEAGTVRQLVNVDLFGEGFDLPAIEVVSFARPTQSFPLYAQQFGRSLRIMRGKDRAIVIDHVGNVIRHGLPDAARVHTLDSRERRGGSAGVSALRSCTACTRPFERFRTACPYCGHAPVPPERSAPEHVDGDLTLLDPATLAEMRGAVERTDRTLAEVGAAYRARNVPEIGVRANVNRHAALQESQARLRRVLAWYAGVARRDGYTERETQRRFFLAYDVDCLTARALPTRDAEALADRVVADLPYAAQVLV